MFCSNCGNKLEDGMQFCPACGMKTGVGKVQEDQVEAEDQKLQGGSGIEVRKEFEELSQMTQKVRSREKM